MVNVGGVKKNQGAAASNDESESGSSQQMFKLGSESPADDLAAEMQSMVMEDDASGIAGRLVLASSNSGSILTTPRNSDNLDGKSTVSESPREHAARRRCPIWANRDDQQGDQLHQSQLHRDR